MAQIAGTDTKPAASLDSEDADFGVRDLPPNLCHCCQKWQVPERGLLARFFNDESESPLYCHFCMHRVCSPECLSEEKYVIPRLFNVSYNIQKVSVCKKAGTFLSKQNYLRIDHKNPQVVLRDEFF